MRLGLYIGLIWAISMVYAVTYTQDYNNMPSLSLLDNRYCLQYGSCTLNNLSIIGDVLNVSVVNYNVTGDIYLNGVSLNDTFLSKIRSDSSNKNYNFTGKVNITVLRAISIWTNSIMANNIYNKSVSYNRTAIDSNFSKYYTKPQVYANHSQAGYIKNGTSVNFTNVIIDGDLDFNVSKLITFGSVADAYITSTKNKLLKIYADGNITLTGATNLNLQADYTKIWPNTYLWMDYSSQLYFNADPDTANMDGYIKLTEGTPTYLDIEAGNGQSIRFLSDLSITSNLELPDSVYVQFGSGGASAGDFQMGYAGSGVLVLDRLTGTGVSATDFVINEASRDLNVRIETDNRDSIMFIDGGLNAIGLGMRTLSSAWLLDVNGTAHFRQRVIMKHNLTVNKSLYVIGNFTANQYYAEMYNYSEHATPYTFDIIANNVYYNITNLSIGNYNGFTFTKASQKSGGSYVTTKIAGDYLANAMVSFSSSGAGGTYGITIGKNHAKQKNCYTRIEASTDVHSVSLNCIIALAINDKVNLMAENEDSTRDMTIHSTSLNLYRVGH